METDLTINESVIIPGAELIISVSRASGPGGQHVNKTSSRVSLRWNILNSQALNKAQREQILQRCKNRLVGEGEILLHVESERSQLRNREIARERLVHIIQDALRVIKKRVATKPSLGSKKRRIEVKKKRGVIKKLRNFDARNNH
jgi:ribosome-associated protein